MENANAIGFCNPAIGGQLVEARSSVCFDWMKSFKESRPTKPDK
jgi:hypothetical protein